MSASSSLLHMPCSASTNFADTDLTLHTEDASNSSDLSYLADLDKTPQRMALRPPTQLALKGEKAGGKGGGSIPGQLKAEQTERHRMRMN